MQQREGSKYGKPVVCNGKEEVTRTRRLAKGLVEVGDRLRVVRGFDGQAHD